MSGQPELGRRLRRARTELGLNQHELAGDGVSPSYISLIESGKREPTQRAVQVLATRLRVSAQWLLTGEDEGRLEQDRTDVAFARLALHEGRHEQARDLLEALLARQDVSDDVVFEARLHLAGALERLGSLKDAIGILETLREQSEADPDRRPWLPVMVSLGRCYREAGDTAHAIDLVEAALARCRSLGLEGLDGQPALVSTLAGLYAERGDHHKAGVVLDQLIESTDAGGGARDRAYAYWNAGINACELGQRGEALRLVEKAAALLADSDDDRNVARLRVSRAWIMLAQQEPDAAGARALLTAVLPSLEVHAGAASVAAAHVELARAELLLGRSQEAAAQAQQALAVVGSDHALIRARAHALLGAALVALGRQDDGRRALGTAADLLEQAGSTRHAASAWRQLADAYAVAGEPGFALEAARRALDAVGVNAEPITPAMLTQPSPDVVGRP